MEKRIRNTFTAIFLAAVMALMAICPIGTVWAEEAADAPTDEATDVELKFSSNINQQNYTVWSRPVKSYLVPLEDGKLMVVQCADKGIVAEYYSVSEEDGEDGEAEGTGEAEQPLIDEAPTEEGGETGPKLKLNLLEDESKVIPLDLPIFGGFLATDDYYFILTGQRNPAYDNTVVVYQVTKYTHKWEKCEESAQLKGCDTSIPFNGGPARMDAEGDYLVIRTCRTQYPHYSDGRNHQSNLTIQIKISTMEVTDKQLGKLTGTGYVSHSMNQFVKVDDGKIVAVDHGDCYPRAVVLSKYPYNFSSGRLGSAAMTGLLAIGGMKGNNSTDTSVGGFEISNTSYLVAGNSMWQNNQRQPKDIFVAAMDKATGKVNVTWLEARGEDAKTTPSTPHLVDFSAGTSQNQPVYIVLWTIDGCIAYAAVDGNGAPIANMPTKIFNKEENYALSDCAPIVSGSSLVWYTRDTRNDGNKVYLHTLTESLNETNGTYELELKAIDADGSTSSISSDWIPPEVDFTPSEPTDTTVPPVETPSSWTSSEASNSSSSGGEYTISFYANGGAITGNSVFATTSGRLSSFPTATRDGYTFEGWYTDPVGGTKVDSSTQFTQGAQLYAHWKEGTQTEYTITFDANGGTIKGSSTQSTVQQKLASMPAAERDGYTFQGWQTADGTSVTAGHQFRQDTTVYAQWAPQALQAPAGEYTITFHANGGSITGNTSIVTVNQKLPSLPSASRDGYTFKGWYDSASGGTQIRASQTFHADATVYAQWAAIEDTDANKNVSVEKVTLKSVKSKAKGKITVSWKRESGASGYQVAYSKTKSFPSKKTAVKNVNASYSAKTFSGLSKGKAYYVRVRAYKKVNGKKSYGKWSSVKKVTVKK